ncbi:hypothetical protein [Blastomonas sp. UPD001]|uniref:hypothetical protein n=1 Tax=Blastomonas sp. UPD001 TaxID=2217673 RepID=UPI001E62BD2D|nr:hypothetical protein [Blastomonas sp. UPD001]
MMGNGLGIKEAMRKTKPTEVFAVDIDSSIDTCDKLFSRVTDVAYLGYGTFSGWDAFIEMFDDRLQWSDIELTIRNRDLSQLPARDRQVWCDVLRDLQARHPAKLKVSPPVDL